MKRYIPKQDLRLVTGDKVREVYINTGLSGHVTAASVTICSPTEEWCRVHPVPVIFFDLLKGDGSRVASWDELLLICGGAE